MNVEWIGDLLKDFVLGIAILDISEKILWSNGILEKICGEENILEKHFYQMFNYSINHIVNEDISVKMPLNKIYTMRAKFIDKEEIFILYINEMTNFNDKDTKLYCLEEIINSINDGIVVSDCEGKVVLYNKSQEKLEELSSDDVLNKYLWEVYEYDPENNPELAEHRNVYKSRTSIIHKYRAHVFKKDIPKYVSYSTYPIVKNGETIAVYSICKNETSLQNLLMETVELKRELFSQGENDNKSKKYRKNGTIYTFSDIIGTSEITKKVIKEAQTISLLDNNILIVGETGTGKEVFAQSIHNFGKNKEEPFVAINCAAIPENLLEGILFGTTKGAYTGALTQSGLFEEARGGTLFLDELNSMPISMQSKLLRVLQEKVVRRVGSSNTIPVDCRVITAVNEEPEKLIEEKRLRLDLFYRISGLFLYIPPLRERSEDIISIGEFYIRKYNRLLHKKVKTFSKELKEIMISYKWHGNVRELSHFVENALVRVDDEEEELNLNHIPKYIKNRMLGNLSIDVLNSNEYTTKDLPNFLRTIEKNIILDTLEKNRWNITKSANELGIIRQSLDYRMKKLNIEK